MATTKEVGVELWAPYIKAQNRLIERISEVIKRKTKVIRISANPLILF